MPIPIRSLSTIRPLRDRALAGPFSNAATSHFLKLILEDEQIRLKIRKQVPSAFPFSFSGRQVLEILKFVDIGFSLAEDFIVGGRVNRETVAYSSMPPGRYTGGLIFESIAQSQSGGLRYDREATAPVHQGWN